MTFEATLFAGRRAIVIGGTSGIGAGTALRLAELGADILAAGLAAVRARRSGPCRSTASKPGSWAFFGWPP